MYVLSKFFQDRKFAKLETEDLNTLSLWVREAFSQCCADPRFSFQVGCARPEILSDPEPR